MRVALHIETGDEVLLRVEQHRVILAKTPRLIDLAGAVEVPMAKRGVRWDEIRTATR